MAKQVEKRFKATITGVKTKGKIAVEDDEVYVEEPTILLTLTMPADRKSIRLAEFLRGAQTQKTVDVTIGSAQFELAVD